MQRFRGLRVAQQPTPKGAWRITFLLFLYMLVNFADKIVVGLAGVPIMNELQLSPKEFGFLGSAFFFLFSISAVVVASTVNCVPSRRGVLLLALHSALLQFPRVAALAFTNPIVCRS